MENKDKVHRILAKSYFFYFVLFLIGIVLDFIFPINIFQNKAADFLGLILIFLSTALILWAQKTSRKLDKENLNKKSFMHGPYKYTRTPTHWGLSILMLSFGITANAFFIVLTTIISFLLTKYTFLQDQEKILSIKYGAPYQEYKKSVSL